MTNLDWSIVGVYLLWKMGAFDGLIKRFGLKKSGVAEVAEEIAGDEGEDEYGDEDDELQD